jgi:ribosome-binding protein aMBF1 (putative translation factor)
MKRNKKERLEKAGWRVGSAEEFLELTDAESALVDIRLTLARALKERRLQRHISQAVLAKQIRSSQSRVAKMEGGDSSVSLDLLMRALMVTGLTSLEIGRAISAAHLPRIRKTA